MRAVREKERRQAELVRMLNSSLGHGACGDMEKAGCRTAVLMEQRRELC